MNSSTASSVAESRKSVVSKRLKSCNEESSAYVKSARLFRLYEVQRPSMRKTLYDISYIITILLFATCLWVPESRKWFSSSFRKLSEKQLFRNLALWIWDLFKIQQLPQDFETLRSRELHFEFSQTGNFKLWSSSSWTAKALRHQVGTNYSNIKLN